MYLIAITSHDLLIMIVNSFILLEEIFGISDLINKLDRKIISEVIGGDSASGARS